jgi:uncharacterized protein (TIGR03435 family)
VSSSVTAPAIAARPPCGFRVGPGRIEGTNVTLDAVAATLSTPLGRPLVVDGGGIGTFDVVLAWNPRAGDSVEVLVAALRDELGLTLVTDVRDVPVVVVRSARRLT